MTSVSIEFQAVSLDMPIIILPSIIMEEYAKMFFFDNSVYSKNKKIANNVTVICRERHLILSDMQISILLLIFWY